MCWTKGDRASKEGIASSPSVDNLPRIRNGMQSILGFSCIFRLDWFLSSLLPLLHDTRAFSLPWFVLQCFRVPFDVNGNPPRKTFWLQLCG